MTGDFLFRMILGHLFGDYVVQSMWMALNKRKIFNAVVFHCFYYTLCVMLFLYPELLKLSVINNIIIASLVFTSHWILDGTDLLEKLLNLTKARTYVRTEEYIDSLNEYSPSYELQVDYARSYNGFVHAVADNTIHLFLMYMIFKFFI